MRGCPAHAPPSPLLSGHAPGPLLSADVLGTQAQVSDFPPSPEALHAAEREALQLVLACYGDALAILRSNKHILIPLSEAPRGDRRVLDRRPPRMPQRLRSRTPAVEELLIQEELTAESVRLLAMSRGGFRAVQEGTSGTGEWGQVGTGVHVPELPRSPVWQARANAACLLSHAGGAAGVG